MHRDLLTAALLLAAVAFGYVSISQAVSHVAGAAEATFEIHHS